MGELMHFYDLAENACLIIPLIAIIMIIVIIVLIIEIKNKKIEEKKKERKLIVIFVVLIVCILILSLTVYSYHRRYVEHEPYRGWYEFQVKIEYNSENKSNIEIDLPLPHDNRIYSELKFSKSSQSQYLMYSINDSDYGKVIHIKTNNTLSVYSFYDDKENKIEPSLMLSAQDGNIAYVKLSSSTPTNCSIWLWYEHTWDIGQGLNFDTYTEYLSISNKPFHVPDKIPDYEVPKQTDIFSEDGTKLSLGWNQLIIAHDEFHMLE